MKVSTKTYYGMRALARLAKQGAPLSVRKISESEELPLEYLEKIFQSLKRAGIVMSKRGSGGGYALAHHANDITLHDIFAELEGSFFTFPCFRKEGCSKEKTCNTKDVWDTINKSIDAKLESITLADIIRK